MKPLFFSLWLAFTPAMTAAETFTLHQDRNWKVGYVTSDNSPFCLLTSAPRPDGEVVGLVAGTEEVIFTLTDNKRYFEGARGELLFWIDDKAPWKTIGEGTDRTLFLGDPVDDVIRELFLGRYVYFDLDMDRWAEYSFSLAGSARAISALAECRAKLS